MDMKSIGEQIRQHRKIKGLTQEELAKESGLSTMSIRRYESGDRIAPQEALSKIAKALGVHLRDLADTSIWEEFDKEYPDAGENAARFEAVSAYLKEMGFWIDFTPEDEDGENYAAELKKDGYTATFTKAEFEAMQAGAKEAIEGRFYKKVLEQQNSQEKK